MLQTTKVAHRTVKVRDLDVFYREAGPKDAPAVLLLHGFPTSSQMFRNLIPALADRYRLLAPDYPGFGHNSMPPRDEFAHPFGNLAGVVEEFTAMLGRRHSVRVVEVTIALLIAARPFAPRASALSSALAVGMFLTTLSFLVTTPGVWEPSLGGFLALSHRPGEFLIKDLALLGISLWTLGEAWQ